MKILIVKTSSLGDIIHVFPLLNLLSQTFPRAQIDWAVEQSFAEIVEAHPTVSQALKVNTKKWRRALMSRETWQEISSFKHQLQEQQYDVVFDLQGNLKSAFVTKLARSDHKVGFGWRTVPEWPNRLFVNHAFNPPQNHNIREDYQFLAEQYFAITTSVEDQPLELKLSYSQQALLESILTRLASYPRRYVMICSGSAWPNKQMTEEALSTFLRLLQAEWNCTYLFIYGNEIEQRQAEKFQTLFTEQALKVERLPLPVLQNLMAKMDLVVAMDSLPLHLAGTTSVPTFSVFGASSAKKYKPLGDRHLSLQGACPYGRDFDKRCPILRTCQTGACIRGLSGEAVFASFQQQWMRHSRYL
jgi:heptosyltransferase-1